MIAVAFLLCLLLVGATCQFVGSRRDARRFPPPGRLVPAGGYRIHLNPVGTGPAVVFISGIAASCLNWTRVQHLLAAHATAVTTDRAGLGWSDLGPRGLTALDHAEHLHEALTRAGVRPPFVLVAHSYGSYVAQLFAARHEAEVAGMVFVDPITWADWVTPDANQRRILRGGRAFALAGAALAGLGVVRFTVSRFRRGSERTGRAVLGAFGSQAVGAVSRVMGEIGKMPPEVWDAVQAHWTRPRSFIAMARHFETLPASAALVRQREADGSAWSCPVVVLSAGDETGRIVEARRGLAARSVRGEFVQVPGAGHWIHLDRPDLVVDAIRALRPLAPGTSRLS